MADQENYRYPGIYSFSEDQKSVFFGRTKDIERLLTKIQVESQVLLYSKSGLGKTSLLNAGVMPRLPDHFVPVLIRFYAYTGDKHSPVESIIKALKEKFGKEFQAGHTHLAKLNLEENQLWEALKLVQLHLGNEKSLVLFFDQFEELFTYPDSHIEEFKRQLHEVSRSGLPNKVVSQISALRKEDPGLFTRDQLAALHQLIHIKTVFSIRTDRLALLDRLVDKLKHIRTNFHELYPLGKEEAIQSITAPAAAKEEEYSSNTFKYSPEALQKIIGFLSDNESKPIETTQLQIICERIEKKQVIEKGKDWITENDVPDFNNVFKDFYLNALKLLTDEQHSLAADLIENQLIRNGNRIALDEEICKEEKEKGSLTQESLDILVGTHLLRGEPNNFGRISYELAHDTLIGPILEEAERKHKEAAAREAIKKQKEAVRIAEEKAREEEKKNKETQRQLRKTQRYLLTAMVTLLIAVVGILVAIWQAKIANQARAKADILLMSNTAANLLDKGWKTEALRVAEAAYSTALNRGVPASYPVHSALFKAFYNTNALQAAHFEGSFGETDKIYFSSGGTHVATIVAGNIANIWDIRGNPIASLNEENERFNFVAFSPLVDRFATIGSDSTVTLWDLDGDKIISFGGPEETFSSVFLSPDGSQIVTLSENGLTKLWDINGNERASLTKYVDPDAYFNDYYSFSEVDPIVFSPDGDRIATSSVNEMVKLWDKDGNEIATLARNISWSTLMVFSPDGNKIASTNDEGVLKLWDRDGNELTSLDEYPGMITSVFFSPTSTHMVVGDEMGKFTLWDTEGNKINDLGDGKIDELEGFHKRIKLGKFSLDNTRIATASSDSTVKLWDMNGNEITTLKGHTDEVNDVAFSPNGSWLATASYDGTAKLWDLNGNELISFQGHSDWVNTVSFSPDSRYLATTSYDGKIKLWLLDLFRTSSFEGHTDEITAVVLHPNGDGITTISGDETVKFWDMEGNEEASLGEYSSWMLSLSLSPDSSKLVTLGQESNVILWDIEGNKLDSLVGYSEKFDAVTFSPDGKRVAISSYNGGVTVWDTEENKVDSLKEQLDLATRASFSPDGSRIITRDYGGSASLWDLQGNNIVTFKEQNSWVSLITFSPDGSHIAAVVNDTTVKLWDRNGKEFALLEGHKMMISSIVFSPDGSRIVTAGWDSTAKIWDISGELVTTLDSYFDYSLEVVYSPDGTRIVTLIDSDDGISVSGTPVRLWDKDGNEIASLEGASDLISSVIFSPDGTRIVTLPDDGPVVLWDYDGNKITSLVGHSNWINSVRFSPDGSRIATAGGDGTARLWDRNGNEIGSMGGHDGEVNSVFFSANGEYIMTATIGGDMKLWRTPENIYKWVQNEGLLMRQLTEEEVKDYLDYNDF